MEVILAKMKALALASYSALEEFKKSLSPGERLAAVAMLQVNPNPACLDWLATRLAEEKPFIGYHAGVALLYAVRILDASQKDNLHKALQKAKASLTNKPETDRAKVIDNARQELSEDDTVA